MKRTEIKRKTELKAKTPIKRGDSQLKRTQIKPKPAAKTVRKAAAKAQNSNRGLEALKKKARDRDEDTCVMCGVVVTGRDSNVHHRRNRGQGGSRKANVITNLITLCGTPATECHGDVTLTPWKCGAEKNGWVLSTNSKQDPAEVPVLVAWLGWAYPTPDGKWRRADPGEFEEVRFCPYCRQTLPLDHECAVDGSPSDLDMPGVAW